MGTALAPQVWKARCKPLDEIVAIKILDLERQDPGKLVRRALCFGCREAPPTTALPRGTAALRPSPRGP